MKRKQKSPKISLILVFAAISIVFWIAAQLRHGGAADSVAIQFRNISYIFVSFLIVIVAWLNTENRRMTVTAAFLAGGMFFGSFFPFVHAELLGHGLFAKYIH